MRIHALVGAALVALLFSDVQGPVNIASGAEFSFSANAFGGEQFEDVRFRVVGGGRRVYRSTPREALPRFPIRGDLSSLLPLLESRVWLEEWLGARAREARTRLRDLLRGYG